MSPALAGGFLTTEPAGKPSVVVKGPWEKQSRNLVGAGGVGDGES